eukprot:347701-Chlamydomonas_euryale.AAC.5
MQANLRQCRNRLPAGGVAVCGSFFGAWRLYRAVQHHRAGTAPCTFLPTHAHLLERGLGIVRASGLRADAAGDWMHLARVVC